VRCFTFGKTDIMPVAYDPRRRQYLVEHAYLTPALGERVVKDAQTLNLALGYEMNTIEFAIRDGVPYATVSPTPSIFSTPLPISSAIGSPRSTSSGSSIACRVS
jgi:hypothetical protein